MKSYYNGWKYVIKLILLRNQQLNFIYKHHNPFSCCPNKLHMSRFSFLIFKLYAICIFARFNKDIVYMYHWDPTKLDVYISEFETEMTIDMTRGIEYIRVEKDLSAYQRLMEYIGEVQPSELPDEIDTNYIKTRLNAYLYLPTTVYKLHRCTD